MGRVSTWNRRGVLTLKGVAMRETSLRSRSTIITFSASSWGVAQLGGQGRVVGGAGAAWGGAFLARGAPKCGRCASQKTIRVRRTGCARPRCRGKPRSPGAGALQGGEQGGWFALKLAVQAGGVVDLVELADGNVVVNLRHGGIEMGAA